MKLINKSIFRARFLPTLFIAVTPVLMMPVSADLPKPFNYNSKSANATYVDNTADAGNGVTNPYYFGGTIGPAEGSSYCSGASNCEDKDSAWKLFGGYRFTDRLSAEGSYIVLGDLHKNGENSDVSVVAAHGVASMPLTEKFDVFGKLGVMRWSSNNTDGSQDGFGVAYGVGTKMHMSETTSLRAEWEKYPGIETSSSEDTDIDMLSVGVELSTF